MNRRKISAMVAAALITSQVQNIAFAETINNSQDTSITSEVINEAVSEDGNLNSEESKLILEESIEEHQSAEEEILEETEIIGDEVEKTTLEGQEIENNEVVKEDTSNKEEVNTTDVYNLTGKLEVDLNFATPIKLSETDKTNIEVKLKDSTGKELGTVKLGSNHSIVNNTEEIKYTLEALDFQRQILREGNNELNFYHLSFNNLPLGNYSIEVVGSGYSTTEVRDIEIQNTSKRVLIGTTDNSVVIDNKGTENESDDIKEDYSASFLVGDLDGNNTVNEADYEALRSAIKNKATDFKYDLNRDGKVDITDLSYVHQNINKSQAQAEIKDTELIINPNNVEISMGDNVDLDDNVDIKDILKDTNTVVALKSLEEVSEDNPISFSLDLQGTSRENSNIEQIVINSPAGGAPTKGSIVIGDEEFKFTEDNIVKESLLARSGEEKLVVNLGKQVAVSKITINITSGSRNNKNLAEIAKVEFLNNVYKELPKPKMNIPVINSFVSTTQVGQESMTIGWDHEENVTGYGIKVEKINPDNNTVINTSFYKTSKNTLRIEKVEAYGLYRISIQSLSGDWESGYKDSEGNEYNPDQEGTTNLTNNSNDKDGKADNVDENYNPISWDSSTGKLTSDNPNFGKDSIIELQVIPETAPEGPEGITVKGEYKKLTVSWKSHAKARDYDLYYRKVGTKAWIKANDPDKSYVDTDLTNEIPDGAANLEAGKATNLIHNKTSYTIEGLEDSTTYEVMMTATNHHGTGGLSQVYMGSTIKLIPPVTTNYKLINTPNGTNELTNHILGVEYPRGSYDNVNSIVDNDYSTAWTIWDWDTAEYSKSGPIVTFDNEYTIDTVKVIKRLDIDNSEYYGEIGFINEEGKWEYREASLSKTDQNRVITLKLSEPIKSNKIQINMSSYVRVMGISEIKFYEYDSLEDEVDDLFADDLHLSIKDNVNQNLITNLKARANAKDEISNEYHPNQSKILEELQRAQELLNDKLLSDNIITLDSSIHNLAPQNTIGQSNNYQALGVAVRPGDKVNIYIGSERKDTKFDLVLTQFNAESGTAYKVINTLSVGKNEIEIPTTGFDMNYEKGGNLYIGLKSGFAENSVFKVRVSGGVEIPHLNVNNIIDDTSKEEEVKAMIKTYIKELETYVNSLPSKYPNTATSEENAENIYTYDPETSILNSTDIEGERIMLSLAADQVLYGIQNGLEGNEEAQVDRLYNTLLAWEQLMKVSYSQQGLLEAPIDFDEDGSITNTPLEKLGGKSENQYYNENRAPKNRMNIKYQRMFTGAFMYVSSHHVGIGYSSIAGTMTGVPFKFNESGELVNANEGDLFGWGISHEIGHVHDINGLTYTETTNNILALITQTFNDISSSRLEGGAYTSIYDKVTSNSIGLASDINTRLGMFWQLHLAYDNDYTYKMLDLNTDNDPNNDTFFAKLYRATRNNGIAVVESGQDRTAQTFIMRASDAAGKDLREFFEKWGLVASPETNIYLNNKKYPKEEKAIYYLNDEARRLRLAAGNDTSVLTMAEDTKVNANFGLDSLGNKIEDRSYVNQKEVPLILSVDKDSNKILGYEIIRKETTSSGTQELVVGFVERDKDGANGLTNYIDEIDAVNNRTFEYKVRAYDYNLNVTEETTIGTIKVNHDGSIAKSNWVFDTNTRSSEDVSDEHSGHGQVQNGSIKKINDNDPSTIYTATKATNNNGTTISGDPYVTIDLGDSKSVIGLRYNPGSVENKKFSLKNFFTRSSETDYSPIKAYEVYVSDDGKTWTKAHSGNFDTSKENKIYFNEKGTSENTQLWAYEAQYVKLVAKGATTISIGEIDILGPSGDNIEIGSNNGNNVYENGIGVLKESYTYAPGQTIPEGSIIVTGEYKGDPAFNVPLVLNENGEHLSLDAEVLLFAEIPDDAELGAVASGTWLYYITPEEQETAEISGNKIKAELYRYNKLGDNNEPIGQRLVSDTFLYDFDLDNLPEIELTNSKVRTLSEETTNVIKVNNDMIQKVFNNRK